MLLRSLILGLVFAAVSVPAGEDNTVGTAALRLEQSADRCSVEMVVEFRMLGAQVLQARHPEMARKFVEVTLEELRAGKLRYSETAVRALATLAPADAVAVLPEAWPWSRLPLLATLASEKSPYAVPLFQSLVTKSPFVNLSPLSAWELINLASSISGMAPEAAADVYDRVLTVVSAPNFGEHSTEMLSGVFQVGTESIATHNRDALLLVAGARLKVLSPARAAKFEPVLKQWKLSGPIQTLRVYTDRGGISTVEPLPPPEARAIRLRLSQFRGMATDADRAKAAIEVAAAVQKLPVSNTRLSLARSLSSLSTEGDLGNKALTAVAAALGGALKNGGGTVSDYLEIAKYIRYEHVIAPFAAAPLEAAGALLGLREVIQQENGFTLAGLDGKTYTLSALHGKVVLLNFWATWCPPCRKEMPDMEKLSHAFSKDLVVLAVSDEDRETVEGFLKKQPYSFPILLDPGRKVATAFSVEGIPKSFLFDREGRLAAQAVDMRTERQFREMFRQAGLL